MKQDDVMSPVAELPQDTKNRLLIRQQIGEDHHETFGAEHRRELFEAFFEVRLPRWTNIREL